MDARDFQTILDEFWGEEAQACRLLVGELDLNVRVTLPGGETSVLKVMHVGADPEHVELRIRGLEELARCAPELPFPRVIPTVEGKSHGLWRDASGTPRSVWRITWREGETLASLNARPAALLVELGRLLAQTQRALSGWTHPALDRVHDWDLQRADAVLERADTVQDPGRRRLLEGAAAGFHEARALLAGLPRVPIHGDGNDHNVLVTTRWPARAPRPSTHISGLLDLGDMVAAPAVCDVAIAAAYAMMGRRDPVGALADLARGFHGVSELAEDALAILLPLVRARLGVSVIRAAERALERPDEAYLFVSETPAWHLLERLAEVPDALATARVRAACGLDPNPEATRLHAWMQETSLEPLLGPEWQEEAPLVLDLGWGSPMLGASPDAVACPELTRRIQGAMSESGSRVGVGRWNEARPIYRAPAFARGPHPVDGARTVHLGLDVWVPADTPLYAPLAGVVESLGDLAGDGNYGPTLLLRHEPQGAPVFWTLWGHMDAETLDRWQVGDPVEAGSLVGRVGAPPGNGNWPPHLHLQIAMDTLGAGHDLPGVVWAGAREAWKGLFPNPAPLAGLDPARVDAEAGVAAAREDHAGLLQRRRDRLGGNLSLSYRTPLHIVSGWRQFLFDAAGRAYLDLYNNVPHVGHQHPRVVRAIQEQVALLNTNTRYLHEAILRYSDALADRLPRELEVVYLVNSASEANELALRMARAYTGRRELVVLAGAYHGHTVSLIQASPYKFDGPGGEGREPWVEVVDLPDLYRGRYREDDPEAGSRYARDVTTRIRRMSEDGRAPGAFMAESLPSVGGQIVLPSGYLKGVYQAVRDAGGVCIADEVQVGFGRLGCVEWGFQLQDVVPDMVVLGKPMGNGFPLGAVVARREIAEAFDNGMEFFATFGGNPVAAAAGSAVLQVLDDEELRGHARRVGDTLRQTLLELQSRHAVVGDVRGLGLFQGIEFVHDPDARIPAPEFARYTVDRLAEEGVLTGTDGPEHNVVKLRGPMVVQEADVARFGAILGGILDEFPAR